MCMDRPEDDEEYDEDDDDVGGEGLLGCLLVGW